MISELIEKLTGGEEDERIYAAEDLGFSDDPQAVEPLLRALETEPSRGVRLAIALALRQLREPSTAERALMLLRSDDALVRNQAVELLRVQGKGALLILEELSRHPDGDIRKFCLDVLAEVHTQEAVELYNRALVDEDLNVVITAIENIGRFRMDSLESAVLAVLAKSEDPMVISAVLTSLAQIGSPASLSCLQKTLAPFESQPEFYLIPLLGVIGKCGSAADLLTLTHVLEQGKPRSCDAALEALGKVLKRHGTEGIDTGTLLAIIRRNASSTPVRNSKLAAVAQLLPGVESVPELHILSRGTE